MRSLPHLMSSLMGGSHLQHPETENWTCTKTYTITSIETAAIYEPASNVGKWLILRTWHKERKII